MATDTVLPSNPAEALRQALGKPLRWLRFPAALESEFAHDMRVQQRRSALFTAAFLTVIWTAFAVLDVVRLGWIPDPQSQRQLLVGVMLPRWMGLAVLAGGLTWLSRERSSYRLHAIWVLSAIAVCGTAVVVSSYTLKNLALPEAAIVILLIVVIAMYPLGILVRHAFAMAVVMCFVITVSGPVVLQRDTDLPDHWVLAAMCWFTLILSCITAYFRERALREQFVLRKLLDWEATHDPLTGLANRRLFRDHFQRCIALAQREHTELHLAIIDVDHFKLYNDHYGHQAGDDALRQLASLLASYARRPMDLAVRLGGEEFALVAYAEDAASVRQRLERLLTELREINVLHAASPTAAHLTVSIGMVQWRDGDTSDTAFKMADTLLYQAKQHGRNRVCCGTRHTHPAESAPQVADSTH